jgi:restriction system protein
LARPQFEFVTEFAASAQKLDENIELPSKGTEPMATRQGLLSELIKTGYKLPWRATSLAAIVVFVIFHVIAIQTASPATGTTLSDGTFAQLAPIHQWALFSQYVIPAALWIGAMGSFGLRVRSKSPITTTQQDPVPVSAMSWRDFERLMGEAFRRRGFTVTGFGGSVSDGGVDLGLMKHGERFLVQCRHWRKQLVDVTVVRELNGVMAAQGAHGGFVVTGGQFTPEARAFAESRKIELVDGSSLERLIGNMRR